MTPTRFAKFTTAPSPAVSVVMAAFNSAEFIEASVDSVLRQTLTSLELLIVDDGSTDRTPELLRRYAALDPRIRIISSPHVKVARARNLAIAMARAPYIAIQDSDDISHSERLMTQVDFMNNRKDVGLVGTSAIRISEGGRRLGRYHVDPLDHDAIAERLKTFRPFCPHSTWLVRKELFEWAGGYDAFYESAEDLDFALRSTHSAFKTAFIAQRLLDLRMRRGSLSRSDASTAVFSVTAVAEHLIRELGSQVFGAQRHDLMVEVSEALSRAGVLQRQIAYEGMVAAYLGTRDGDIRATFDGLRCLIAEPTAPISRRRLAARKSAVAVALAREWVGGAVSRS